MGKSFEIGRYDSMQVRHLKSKQFRKSLENVLQLSSARQILGHFIYLSETATLSAVKTQISNEVESAWINLNIYPVTRKIISK